MKRFHGTYDRKKREPKPKKHVPSLEEIANDPSLRWFPYRTAEVIFSDTHGTELRFMGYDGEQVKLATLNGIAPIAETVHRLTVRRLTAKN